MDTSAKETSANTKQGVRFDGEFYLLLTLFTLSSLAAVILYVTAEKTEDERHYLSLELSQKVCEEHIAGVQPMWDAPPPPSQSVKDLTKGSVVYDPSLQNAAPPDRMARAEKWLTANSKYVKCIDDRFTESRSVLDNVALVFQSVLDNVAVVLRSWWS